MPFFEPEPPPPTQSFEDERAQNWAPPLWDRPSEGTYPGVVTVGQLFGVTESTAFGLDAVRVYPNGFVLDTTLLVNPRLPPSHNPRGFGFRLGGVALTAHTSTGDSPDKGESTAPPAPPANPFRLMWPRIGVQFADGRRAGDANSMSAFNRSQAKDDLGIPTDIVIGPMGGGGGSHGFRFGTWIFPLPPAGPLDIYAEWSTIGLQESRITIDGGTVIDAAQRARVIWS